MTYSYPKYNRVEHVRSPLATKYKLYIYRDGYRDSDTLFGTPALFIPGQAGSYGQIRSLASTTTNLFHENQKTYNKNMDFFTVDLNEELSALNGQNLLDQAVYLNDVIKRIRELYQGPVPVMIIGHSMGGIVARAMFLQPNYIPGSIDTIVTIATPHLAAPLLLDPVIYKTYNDIIEYWKRHQQDILKEVTMISIAGGSLDNIIHSDGVNMDSFVPKANGFTTYTTSIPNVWTGCDHMAVLWCKQFIQTLSSTLLQVINSENTVEERMRIFKYNFFVSAPKKLQLLTNLQPQFDMRWSIVLCKGTDIYKLDCEYMKPKVTLLPSATAQNLIESSPYRLLEITKTNYDYVGVINHGGQKIVGNEDKVFLIGHEISSEPTLHSYSVWGNVLFT
ncbi:PGAP1-like protein-domain-containing protein [Pilaira anomala]|nr:PGAP1-like protein-domain-containing protein [Pilaira anomala]